MNKELDEEQIKALAKLSYEESYKQKCDDDKTPLEALEKVRHCTYPFAIDNQKAFDIIEKSLKALEIIKKKTQYFVDFEEDTKTIYIDCALDCDNEEYNLLKEVLE